MQIFSEMAWDDLWPDAGLVRAVGYLRGSKGLAIPPEWREFLPTNL